MPTTDSARRPLIVTSVDDRRDAVLRLCAAAGVEPIVCNRVATARAAWAQASMVVLGEDALAAVADKPFERRADVYVVVDDDPPPAVWSHALAVGAQGVVSLPSEEEVLGVVLVDRADGAALDAPVLAVVGGSGGVGASSLASAVAMTAALDGTVAEQGVLLIDGDPWGGGLDVLLGEERAPGLRWGDLVATDGRLSGTALRRAVPHAGRLGLLSWERGTRQPAPESAVRSVLAAARRAHALVVVDVPRHPDSGADVILAVAARTVLLAPDDVRGAGASAAVAARCGLQPSRARVVVRRRRGGLPPSLVADTIGLPLLGTVGDDARYRRAVEEGLGPLGRRTAVRAAARGIWTRLAEELD